MGDTICAAVSLEPSYTARGFPLLLATHACHQRIRKEDTTSARRSDDRRQSGKKHRLILTHRGGLPIDPSVNASTSTYRPAQCTRRDCVQNSVAFTFSSSAPTRVCIELHTVSLSTFHRNQVQAVAYPRTALSVAPVSKAHAAWPPARPRRLSHRASRVCVSCICTRVDDVRIKQAHSTNVARRIVCRSAGLCGLGILICKCIGWRQRGSR